MHHQREKTAKKDVKAYFCPISKQMCQGGETKRGQTAVECQFWSSVPDPGECRFVSAIRSLDKLGQIAIDISEFTIAARR